MARLKKLLLLANQHITRFHKELAAKDEQLRVLLACYTRRPGSATAHHLGLLGRTLLAPGCATHLGRAAEPLNVHAIRAAVRDRPNSEALFQQVLLPTDAEASTSEVR